MTATEIRNEYERRKKLAAGPYAQDHHAVFFLAEIAAQLAELNFQIALGGVHLESQQPLPKGYQAVGRKQK